MLHCSCLHCSFSCLHCLFRILLCIDAVCSQVSSFTGVPTMMRDMMEHPSFTVDRVASLKSLAAGGLTAQTLIIAPLILILSVLTLTASAPCVNAPSANAPSAAFSLLGGALVLSLLHCLYITVSVYHCLSTTLSHLMVCRRCTSASISSEADGFQSQERRRTGIRAA